MKPSGRSWGHLEADSSHLGTNFDKTRAILQRPCDDKGCGCRGVWSSTTGDAVVPLRGVDDAATLKIRCDRCQKAFGKKHWTKLERNHRKYYQTKLVCQACRADGFHAWNLRAYPCHLCAGMFGSNKYNLRSKKKQKGSSITCKDCDPDMLVIQTLTSSKLICKDCELKIRCGL